MTKLESLINELCPNGVEYKKSIDICDDAFWLMPSTPNYIESGIPYITSKNVKNGKLSFDDVSYISTNDYYELSKNRFLKKGDFLITMIGTIGETAFVDDFVDFYGQNIYVVRLKKSIINPRFYYYYFQTQREQLISKKNTSSQGYIKAGSINNLEIPVPPRPVQDEIVRILDKMTDLTTMLTTELDDRKKQYEYYSNYFFDEAKKAKYDQVKKVCKVTKGKSPIQKTKEGPYPMVVTTSERKTSNEYQFDCKGVCIPLISSRGHGIASLNHVYYQEGQFALGNILCAVVPFDEKKINAKYLYYYFELTKNTTLVPLMKGGANVAMHLSDVENVKIPIPSLEEQERIVSILDKFDKYCNDLSEGLPSEIELRQKQYEYYRDKLLTFKRLNA